MTFVCIYIYIIFSSYYESSKIHSPKTQIQTYRSTRYIILLPMLPLPPIAIRFPFKTLFLPPSIPVPLFHCFLQLSTMSGCFVWRSTSRSPKKAKESGSPDSFRLSVGELTDVHPVPASVTRSGKSSMATSATSSRSGEIAFPPEEYLTCYVGPGRKEFKVPQSFRDYESFKQLLAEAKRDQNCEIVEDVGGAILLDSVKLEYFEFVKKNIEWKEKEKRALEKSYCDALWTRQK